MNLFFKVKREWSSSSCPVFLNYTSDDITSWDHICCTGQLNRKDPRCFIVTAYFPLQVLVLVFVKVITLPLKMLYRVCGKTLDSYWSWLEHCHLLSLWEVRCFGPLHHREKQKVSAKCWVVLSGGNWWYSQWLTRNNTSSWPTLFWIDKVIGSLL